VAFSETIVVGQSFRTGSASNGFPEFLAAGDTNVSTHAWNIYGSTQTLNGVRTVGTGGSFVVGDLTIFAPTNTYTAGYPVWTGDPQQGAKENISRTGRWQGAPGSWSIDIAATPGTQYEVQLLSAPVGANNNRTLDVTVDGSLFADDLFVPGVLPNSVVFRFPVTADADGIDITFGAGGDFAADGSPLDVDNNPWVTAVAITRVLDPNVVLLADVATGGDGSGTGTPGNALDPRDGSVQSGDPSGLSQANDTDSYSSVASNLLVDGVFIPDGGAVNVTLNSLGDTYGAFPNTDSNSWDYIEGQVNQGSGSTVGGVNYDSANHTMIGMHANKGITFDLDAIRANAGLDIERFTAVAGNGGGGAADFWVFLDGALMANQTGITNGSGAFPLDIPISSSDRFLTLVSTDFGNTYGSDQIFFGDPMLTLVPEPSAFALAALGLLGLLACGRRRRR